MADLESIVRGAPESSVLAFRAKPYGSEHERFLTDLLALCNAHGSQTRVLCVGVDNQNGQRTLLGLDADSAAQSERALALVQSYVEPDVSARFVTLEVDGVTVGAYILTGVTETPYLMAKDFSPALVTGMGFVREELQQRRLTRTDLRALFQNTRAQPKNDQGVFLAFATKNLITKITLPALPLTRLPSAAASDRIKTMMAAKEEADKVSNLEDSRIERLVHARLYGHTAPYQQMTPEALREKADNSKRDNAEADRYYINELRAHKINFLLVNQTQNELKDVHLTLEFPKADGFELSERIFTPPGKNSDVPSGYPALKLGQENITTESSWPRLPAGSKVTALTQPLRLQLRENAVGKTIPVRYILRAKNLPDLVIGSLPMTVAKPS
ncbi:MAG: hypothetical protein AAF438_01900 [Pseudomonadota bacterium]